MWHHDDWIKTMILFFDGIGILLPDYLKGKPERADPAIAIPLREQGLLHILEPETDRGQGRDREAFGGDDRSHQLRRAGQARQER